MNNGDLFVAETQDVEFTLTGSDSGSGVDQMRFSIDDGGSWTEWESFSSIKSFRILSIGMVEVLVELRDVAGRIARYSDSIFVFETAPLALEHGQSFIGTINKFGQTDAYTFNGETEDLVRVRMSDGSTLSSSIENKIQIFDPQGVLIATGKDDNDAVVDVTLESSGQFLILLSSDGDDDSRSYGANLQRLNNPGGATAIEFGQSFIGTINKFGQTDAYTFNGETEDLVRVRMSDGSTLSSSIENKIQIFDPQGVLIATGKDDNDAVVDVTLESSGQFLILLSSDGDDDFGSYTINLEHLSGI